MTEGAAEAGSNRLLPDLLSLADRGKTSERPEPRTSLYRLHVDDTTGGARDDHVVFPCYGRSRVASERWTSRTTDA